LQRTLLNFMLVLFATITSQASKQAQTDAGERPVTLTTIGPAGAAVTVDGIVCDNLRDTPAGQKNHLDIVLPASFSALDTTSSLANPDATMVDEKGHNNVGSVVVHEGHFTYYPPDEFNSIQEPESENEVDGPATRVVMLTIRRPAAGGESQTLPPIPIVLARPPAVLVHGINAGPEAWLPLVRGIAGQTGAAKKALEFPVTTLDHRAPSDYAGSSFQDHAKYPEGLFAGCGPVEVGAALLARRIQQTLSGVRIGAPLPLLETQASGHVTPFTYRAPGPVNGPGLRLAIRRVDVVAWSYGGTIARWYTASTGERYPQQAAWYHGRYVVSGAHGRPIDLCPQVRYRGDVRKLITIGSLWRGVPLNNYLGEVRFSSRGDAGALAAAPLHFPNWLPKSLTKQMGSRRTLGGLIETIDVSMKLIAPASEVCAVDSPWLTTLTYGRPDAKLPRAASPFRDEIAYGSVAGDDSAYFDFGPLKGVSLYGAALFFQQPSRFPFLYLERRAGASGSLSPLIGGANDYSDGLIPLWSALIPGSAPGTSQIVHASHRTYMGNRDTQAYVARWLNNAALPTGRELRPQWNTSITSRDNRKRWVFREGEMAPENLTGLYARIDGIGRIQPNAIHPDRTITIKRADNGVVRVEWALPAGGRLQQVKVYEDAAGTIPGPTRRTSRMRIVRASMAGERLCALFEYAPVGRNCTIVAEGIIDNHPDQPVIIESKVIRLSTAATRVGPRVSTSPGEQFPPHRSASAPRGTRTVSREIPLANSKCSVSPRGYPAKR
jgi:pimeloyl-ACP methyl ester carboxylesterase